MNKRNKRVIGQCQKRKPRVEKKKRVKDEWPHEAAELR